MTRPEYKLAAILALVLAVGTARAQILTTPENAPNQRTTVRVLGQGDLSGFAGDNLGASVSSPSARFAFEVRPSDKVETFFSFNKGAGLTPAPRDSFSLGGLVFPTLGNSAFLGSVKVWMWQNSDNTHSAAAGPIIEAGWQQYSVSMSGEIKHFETRLISAGVYHEVSLFHAKDGSSNAQSYDRLRIGSALTWLNIKVARSGVADYRLIAEDPDQAKVFNALRLMTSISLNDLTLQATYVNAVKTGDGNDRAGIAGDRLEVKLSASGSLAGWHETKGQGSQGQ